MTVAGTLEVLRDLGYRKLTPEESELRCETCRLGYRIDDGIPILLIDEATPYE